MNLPRLEKCGYVFDKSIPFLEEAKGGSQGGQAAQYQRPSKTAEVLQSQGGPLVPTPARGLAGITWSAGRRGSEPRK